MSKINLNNYEAFMLDYLEGNLSAEDINALKLFADIHPELELNFDEELVMLENEKISFEGKQNLRSDFSDELVIGYLENILEGKEKIKAEELAASNAIFNHELELYKKTIVVADTDFVFENKEKLKRRTAVIFFPQNNYVNVAATLLLLLGLWFMVSHLIKNDVKVDPGLAKKETVSSSQSQLTVKTISVSESLNPNTDKLVTEKTIKQNSFVVKKEKEVNTGIVSVSVPDKKEEPQLADRTPKESEPIIQRDTNAVLMANNSIQEKLVPKYVIEEGADDEPAETKQKSRLWNIASGVFKGLNKRGIENVNGTESNSELFIGALTISKPN